MDGRADPLVEWKEVEYPAIYLFIYLHLFVYLFYYLFV